MTDFQLTTPVAFLIFNRPDTTARVFEAIRQAKPPQLLVVADGPRPDRADDIEKCKAARAIIEGVDWDCEVLTNYSDLNLGCKNRVSSGLDWVFSHIWGWATWRRAWQYYDVKMKLWQEIRDGNWLESILGKTQAVKYWTKIFQTYYDGKIDTWDYPWNFACWIQNGLTILPNVNLVSNIGFGEDATHTIGSKSRLANLPVKEMNFPLEHPPFLIRHVQADDFTHKHIYKIPILSLILQKFRNFTYLNLEI